MLVSYTYSKGATACFCYSAFPAHSYYCNYLYSSSMILILVSSNSLNSRFSVQEILELRKDTHLGCALLFGHLFQQVCKFRSLFCIYFKVSMIYKSSESLRNKIIKINTQKYYMCEFLKIKGNSK